MKVKFLSTLDVRDIDDHNWELLADYSVVVDKTLITVPAGTVTDFASVPRLPITYMLFGNVGHRAAVVHDWLYKTGNESREKADSIFKAILIAEGVGNTRANIMYYGVRMFGEQFYKEKV